MLVNSMNDLNLYHKPLPLYFQNLPVEDGAPEYEIVEITPNELEAIANIHNPALDHLVYPAEYYEALQGNR